MTDDPRPSTTGANADTTGSRWAELKDLFDSAISLQGPDREFYISQKCGPNEELRRELQSLLVAYEETGDFLERPFASIKAFSELEPAAPDPEPSLIGSLIGHYRLDKEIGRGGMGAVYLATRADDEFRKRVAIKLIRNGREDDFAIRRFRHERQILARIENPYVARLIDGGTTDKGLPYFVMEYVEGRPITQYCDAESFTTRERVELFVKVCSAVHYAHERNIIHRDLKPGNILVKDNGTPKLLDFGIAKIMGADVNVPMGEATVAGFRMLTPAYASPEQMRGEPATVRSDVYALGIILYELLCGERPSLNLLQQNTATAERTEEAHLSPHLRAIIFNAIRWKPEERYPTVEAFSGDLKRYLEGFPPNAGSQPGLEFDAAPSEISIAILPLRVLAAHEGSDEFLSAGITEALITRLSRVQRLSVRPTSSVLKYANRTDPARTAKELRVKYVLEGSVHRIGDLVRVSVQLVYAEAGIAVWADQFDEPSTDLLKLEDSIAEHVAFALIPHLTGEEREQLSKSGTASGLAHESYLRGRWHWSRSTANQEELAKALVCFMRAIEEDPNYARAHAGVADYYLRLGLWGGLPPSESFAAAFDSAQKAVQLDPTLGEAHASLGFAIWAFKRDYATAEKHFNLAIIRNSEYASAHHWFGLLNSARNRPELAIANLERARKLDPNSPMIAAALGLVHYNARQFEKAARTLLDAARELRNSAVIQEILAWSYLRLGDLPKALAAARQSVELSGRVPSSVAVLASVEAACDNKAAAVALCDELEGASQKRYISPYDRATAALAAGNEKGAIRWLEQADADGDWWLFWIAVDPRWDKLRNDPRFTRLVLNTQPAKSVESAAETAGSVGEKKKRIRLDAIAATLAILAVLGVAWYNRTRRSGPPPFEDLRFARITSNGIADSAVISPDGRYVAYTALEGGDTGVFLRETATARVLELVPSLKGTVTGLNFTNNGKDVSFVSFAVKEPSNRHLYTVGVNGGAPHSVLDSFPGPVSLSPDGRLAVSYEANQSVGNNELWITNVSTGERRLLAALPYAQKFAWTCPPTWSQDGSLIATAIEEHDSKGFAIKLYVTPVKGGAMKLARSPRWQLVQRIAWSGDNSAMAIVGQEQDSSFQQIWYVAYPSGYARRIGNDLDDYVGVSLTRANDEMVSVQMQTRSNVYIWNPADPAHPRKLTQGSGRYFDLAWLPDGRLLYASDATGSADIWVMNADGSDARQVTAAAGRNYAPASSPDGKTIAFHSNRTSNWHIWRTDIDGTNVKELSTSLRDGNWPVFSKDGKSILFHQSDAKGLFSLWQVPASGGAPQQFTSAYTMHPAVSAKTGEVAAWFADQLEHPHWKLSVFRPEGGDPIRILDPTPAAKQDTTLRWTPNGEALTFIDFAGGVSNIWLLPVNGGPPRKLTNFTSDDIYSFDWSKDGTLVFSRGLTTSDVVLIRDANRLSKNSAK